jgi:hypothetical protein
VGWTASSVQALASFNGRLYAGLTSDGPSPGLVWVFDEQTGWRASSSTGFGGANSAVNALAVYDGALFAATSNPQGGQVWSSGGTGWSHAADEGFADPSNVQVTALAVYGNRLFAGTSNASGAQIWAHNGQEWTRVASAGLTSQHNVAVEALAVHAGRLYAGTRNAGGAQVWRSSDGDHWEVAASNGFGYSSNVSVTALASYGGALYAAVENNAALGCEIWYEDWRGWHRSVEDGFAGPSHPLDSHNLAVTSLAVHDGLLFAGTLNDAYGAQLWFLEGSQWWPSTRTGLGIGVKNRAVRALASYGGSLWAGIESSTNEATVWYGLPALSLGVDSRYASVPATFNVYYEVEIANTLGITLTGLQAFHTWESSGGCLYDLDGRSHVRWDIGDMAPGDIRTHQFTLATHSWCLPQVVRSEVRLQGDNLAPMFAFASTAITEGPTPTPAPTATPTASPTPRIPLLTALQQGSSGYAGTLDTHLTRSRPAQSNCNEPFVRVGDAQGFVGLLRFDLTTLPVGADVVSATLRLHSVERSNASEIEVGAYVVSRTVDICQANWNDAGLGELWGAPGGQDVQTDRPATSEASTVISGLWQWYEIDVTAAVRNWVEGNVPNNGLILLARGSDSGFYGFASASYSQPALRPVLSVAHLPPLSATPTASATPTRSPSSTAAPTQSPTASATTTPSATLGPTATTSVCPDPYEPNDGLLQAWYIGWGGHFESYVCSAADEDYFQADLAAWDFDGFQITLSSLPENYDLRVYDPSGKLIALSARPGLETELVTVRAQEAVIAVLGAAGTHDAAHPYDLDVIPVKLASASPTPSPTPTSTGSPRPTVTPTRTLVSLSGRIFLPLVSRPGTTR